jgi:tetratricopeptide (TPR) repeat protein
MKSVNPIVRTLALAALLLVPPLCTAQFKKLPPPPPPEEEEEPAHRHKLQPAWKSVEVGDYYLMKKKYRAALSRYEEAVAADPEYPRAYLGMGKIYDRLGLAQKALENYQKYLDLLPSAKQAEEARSVHKAIARLQKKLSRAAHSSAGSPPSSD